jgi:SagB-type dehydrogenase family enzyme
VGTWAIGKFITIVLLLALALVACAPLQPLQAQPTAAQPAPGAEGEIALPAPQLKSGVSLEEALQQRRSVRAYANEPLTLEEIGQLFWAAQGVTQERGLRTAPSAGALYPLELYAATDEGLYHYVPQGHRAQLRRVDGWRAALCQAALSQSAVCQAPVVFVVTAVYARTAGKYGERAERYVQLEAGHAAQNLLLQAVALDLAAVPVGAFSDEQVQAALGLPADHKPLYLIPVGHP